MRRMLRSLALVVLALGLTAQAASLAHFALVQHATCADHGEVVHAASQAGAEAKPSDHATLQGDVDSATHGHDHCVVLQRARERATAAIAPAVAASDTLNVTSALPLFASVEAGIPCLLRAPKTSPPV